MASPPTDAVPMTPAGAPYDARCASYSTGRWAGCGADDSDTTLACAYATDGHRRECISTARWVASPYVFFANLYLGGFFTARWVGLGVRPLFHAERGPWPTYRANLRQLMPVPTAGAASAIVLERHGHGRYTSRNAVKR